MRIRFYILTAIAFLGPFVGARAEDSIFNPDPVMIEKLKQITAQSQVRSSVRIVPGFNDQLHTVDATRLEKLVREETPYTVRRLAERWFAHKSERSLFQQLGLVVGDPHFGNFNIQPMLSFQKKSSFNRYTLVDLDEVAIGYFALDFARYVIFLKARFGSLQEKFGPTFGRELIEAYDQGLQKKGPPGAPELIAKPMEASAKKILEKVEEYAKDRVDSKGEFRKDLFKKGDLVEFSVKNMKPGFLEKMHFDPASGDKKQFKQSLFQSLAKTIEGELGTQVDVLDIAIPEHETGGSSAMQRFLISAQVRTQNQQLSFLIEFKENSTLSAWQAVIETPIVSSEQRYQLAKRAALGEDSGPFLKVVSISPEASFLMRPRGNLDIDPKSKADWRELALYDSYLMGAFHGAQDASDYQKQIHENLSQFQSVVMTLADQVLQQLSAESGLEIPHSKDLDETP